MCVCVYSLAIFKLIPADEQGRLRSELGYQVCGESMLGFGGPMSVARLWDEYMSAVCLQ